MGSLNVNLINGPRRERGGDADVNVDDKAWKQKQCEAFEAELGVDQKTLKTRAREIDQDKLKQINEDFLHSSIALNALHDAYNSASKQNSAAYKGDEALRGGSELMNHANKELTLASQEIVLNSPAPAAAG